MNGKYIVFEGIDGSGKTSISSIVAEFLVDCGHNVLQITEPSQSEIGMLLRKQSQALYINQISLALLYASDSYDIQERVENNYEFIIGDRSYLSTIAYQMTFIDKDWLMQLHRFLKKPDAIFYLDVSADTAMKRINHRPNGGDCFETLGTLKKAKQNYEQLISEEYVPGVIKIETEGKHPEEVAKDVISIIRNRFLL